ncbi:MAG: hypothetical protein Q8N15_03290, partial [Bacillota bacterium]|nr:hypothetical protein [Bacillota bacterium]
PLKKLPWFYRRPLHFAWKEPLLPLLYVFLFFVILPFVLLSTVILLAVTNTYFSIESMYYFHGAMWRPIWGSFFLAYSVLLSVVFLFMIMTAGKPNDARPELNKKNIFRFLPVRIVLALLILGFGSLAYEYRTFGDFGYDLGSNSVVFSEPYRWASPDTYDTIDEIASIRIESANYTRSSCRIYFTVTMTDGRTAMFRDVRTMGYFSSYLTHPTLLEDLFLEYPERFTFANAEAQTEFMEAISWENEDPSNL